MQMPLQAMLLNRLRALSQTRSLQRQKAHFTFSPKEKSIETTSLLKDNQSSSIPAKAMSKRDLNKKTFFNKLHQKKDSTPWNFNAVLSWLGWSKPNFTAHYRKENRTRYTQEELLEKLEQLGNLSYGKEYSLQENYQHELEYGDKDQAQAWLFGARYKEAMRHIQTVAEIELMYEAIVMWFRLQAQAGLLVTPEQVRVELNKLAAKESEIINAYDTQSMAVLHKYLSDMKNDLYNEFRQWFDARFANLKQVKQPVAVSNQEAVAGGRVNVTRKKQQ